MPSTPQRIVSAVLLLPLILFSAVWTSFSLWRCQSDGIARSECCCPAKSARASAGFSSDAAEGPSGMTLSRPGCCDVEQHRVQKAPAEKMRSNAAQTAALLSAAVAAIPVGLLPAPDFVMVSARAASRGVEGPPGGRALLVVKQAFLI